MTKLIICYLLLITLATFIVYGIDKYKAKHDKWRISEAKLLLLAAVGGSVGALLAMKTFRHKTLHKKFIIGVPLILLVQLVGVAYIYFTFFHPTN